MGNKFEYQGQALKELRNKANYTMLEVAERRGKTKSWLSEIENGRKMYTLKMLNGCVICMVSHYNT